MEIVINAANAITGAATNPYNIAKAAVSTAPPSDEYLSWNAPGVEDVKPDEEETARKIGEAMNKGLQDPTRRQHCITKNCNLIRLTRAFSIIYLSRAYPPICPRKRVDICRKSLE
jgi:hypothetical protein